MCIYSHYKMYSLYIALYLCSVARIIIDILATLQIIIAKSARLKLIPAPRKSLSTGKTSHSTVTTAAPSTSRRTAWMLFIITRPSSFVPNRFRDTPESLSRDPFRSRNNIVMHVFPPGRLPCHHPHVRTEEGAGN